VVETGTYKSFAGDSRVEVQRVQGCCLLRSLEVRVSERVVSWDGHGRPNWSGPGSRPGVAIGGGHFFTSILHCTLLYATTSVVPGEALSFLYQGNEGGCTL
jgi:hypothetical protein